ENSTGPEINVVFYVAGSLGSPDWDGVRDAKFSRKRQLLMVQVAVPPELVRSRTLNEYLFDSLDRANAVAFEFFRTKGLSFPLADAERLVRRIRERVESEIASSDGGQGSKAHNGNDPALPGASVASG